MHFLKILREFLWLKFREFFTANDAALMHKYDMGYTDILIIKSLRGILGTITYIYLNYHIRFLWSFLIDWKDMHWLGQTFAGSVLSLLALAVLGSLIAIIWQIIKGLKVFFRYFPYIISKNWHKAQRNTVCRDIEHIKKKKRRK